MQQEWTEKYKHEGTFKLHGGFTSKIYYDFKPMIDNNEEMTLLANFIKTKLPCNLIGISTFGVEAVIWLRKTINKKCFNAIRMHEVKNYGMTRFFYGKFYFLFDTYVLDDVITTGKTFIQRLAYLNTLYLEKIKEILVLKNRTNIKSIFVREYEIKITEISRLFKLD